MLVIVLSFIVAIPAASAPIIIDYVFPDISEKVRDSSFIVGAQHLLMLFLGSWFPCKLFAYPPCGWLPSSVACFVGNRNIRRKATLKFGTSPLGHAKILYVSFVERDHFPAAAVPQSYCSTRTIERVKGLRGRSHSHRFCCSGIFFILLL